LAKKLDGQYNPESAPLPDLGGERTASGKWFCIAGQAKGIKIDY
jgi:hypothetical protein